MVSTVPVDPISLDSLIKKYEATVSGSIIIKRARLVLPKYDHRGWEFHRDEVPEGVALPEDFKPAEIAFFDLTGLMEQFIGYQHILFFGTVKAISDHTTMAVLANEYGEEGYRRDTARTLFTTFPAHLPYAHNVKHVPRDCPNGHSHQMADRLTNSRELSVSHEKLERGRYMRVFAVDLYPIPSALEPDKRREITFVCEGAGL